MRFDDRRENSARRGLFVGLFSVASEGLAHAAIFARTVAGLWVLGDLIGVVLNRRRQRDSLGL